MENLYKRLLDADKYVSNKSPKKRRFVSIPDTSTLTEQQAQVWEDLKNFIEDPEAKLFLLQGYAGTGKTFVISMFVEWLLAAKNKKVAMTAPTNKAVKVLRRAGEYTDLNLYYVTVHSLLGLREVIDNYGKVSFAQNNAEDAKVGDYNVIIVDEVSMLQDDLLKGSKATVGLLEYAKMLGTKIIFVGDPCQIPPIGRDNCIPFIEDERKRYGIGITTLTDIVRQSLDNPIIQITLAVRNNLGRDIIIPIREDKYNDEDLSGVYYIDFDLKSEFNALLKNYFTSDAFKQDEDFVKIVAYRNITVKAFNNKIRKMLFGDSVGKLAIGDKLVVDKPIFNELDETIMFTVNDELEVDDFTESVVNYKGIEFNYYDTTVLYTDVDGNEIRQKIKVLHESSEEDYELVLKHLSDVAKEAKKGSWEAGAKWREFYAYQKFWAHVSYNYAITAHKAQGSTYTHTFVLEEDINVMRKIKERNRIKYTAFTRPKERLFIIA